eukprot:XP_011677566.1 PREDICTED: protein phosphatase 1 regulatory subunit 16A-like [Strongylocentrotus purpuratus]
MKAIGTVGKVVEIDGSEIRVKIKDNQTLIFNSANLAPERIRAPRLENVNPEENLRGIPRAMQDPEWPIMAATEAGDIKEMERILAIHPEWIHYEYEPGCSLLGFIAGTGNVHKVKFLLEKGAFTECIDMNGWRAEYDTCTSINNWRKNRSGPHRGQKGSRSESRFNAMTKLLDKIPRLVEAMDENGRCPLYSAAFKGCRDAAELLIKKGRCNVNVVDSECGTCPLAAAIFFQNFHLVDVLVKHGADINLPNIVGKTSLQFAVDVHATRGQDMKEEPYMAEMKMKWGHLGIKTNSDALLAFLVSHGGDLNAFNSERKRHRQTAEHSQSPPAYPDGENQ